MQPVKYLFLLLFMITGITKIKAQDHSRYVATNVELNEHQKKTLQHQFRHIQAFRMNLPQLYEYASQKKTIIPLHLEAGELKFDIEISQHDLRSADYRHVVSSNSGRVLMPREECTTYAGFIKQNPSSYVRLNIRPGKFSALIHQNDDDIYIESLTRHIPEADPQLIIIYRKEDLQPVPGFCGGGTVAVEISQKYKQLLSKAKGLEVNQALQQNNSSNFSPAAQACRKLEIATESDYENYDAGAYRMSPGDIQENLNLVEPLYSGNWGIYFKIRYQHEWTTSNDPYSIEAVCTNTNTDRIVELQNYWNLNFTDVPRDVVIMYTGIDMNGGTIGCAKTGASTQPANNVGINSLAYVMIQSVHWDTGVPFVWTDGDMKSLVGHELGHYFGCAHDDSNHNIMEPTNHGYTNFNSAATNTINASIADADLISGLSTRYILNQSIVPGGTVFNGGEIYIQAPITSANTGSFDIEAVDNCTANPGTILSASGTGNAVTLKIAACNNGGY